MGKAQVQPTSSNTPNFDQIWAILDRTAKQQKETARRQKENAKQQEANAKQQEETNRQIKEAQQETDRQMKETDRQIKDINKRFGDYSNRLGEIAEYMVAPNLREKFKELGFDFPKASKNTDVSDRKNKIFFEIDIFLENSKTAMLVEIKTKLIPDHIITHVERMEKMRTYSDLHDDKRTFLGAVAGVVIPDNIKELALTNGFFVIEPSGETFNITPPHGKPKEW